MKPLLIAVGVAGLVLGQVGYSWAHVGDRVYPIFELTDEDVARIDVKDGSIDDWLDVVGAPSLTALDFEPTSTMGFARYDPADLDFRIWIAWHRSTRRIYVAMERADDIYANEFDRRQDPPEGQMTAHDTGISFTVDGDHSGGQFAFGTRDPRWMRQAQGYSAIAEVFDGGSQVAAHGNQGDADLFFLRPPYAEAGGRVIGENPTISVTEFYVTSFDFLVWDDPTESVVSEWFPGEVIGLDFFVTDAESGKETPTFGHRLSRAEWCGSYCDPTTANHFVDGILLGPGGEIPDDSAVEDITWARIKAGFRD